MNKDGNASKKAIQDFVEMYLEFEELYKQSNFVLQVWSKRSQYE